MIKHISILILTLSTLLAIPIGTYAQVSKSREVHKVYKISKGTQVDIINKYGNIQIETWDVDSVKLDIVLTVTEKNKARLHKKFNSIEFELTQTSQYLIIETKLGDEVNDIDKFLNKFKENFGIGDADINIDYSVILPNNLSLSIQNKFGNIYLSDYNGEVELDLSGGGKIKARELKGHTKLKVNTGDTDIDYVESGYFEINYGDLSITKAGKLTINSRNSDVTIREVKQLVANSTIDEYRIRSVDELENEAKYTEFIVQKLKLNIDAKVNASDIEVNEIETDFSKIYIDGKSSDIYLEFNDQTEIRFDILAIKPTIELPENTEITTQEEVDTNELKFQYKGYHGVNSDAPANIVLRTKTGKINIYKK